MEQINGQHDVPIQTSENPKLLRKSAGGESCCIFKVPQSLVRNNKTAYEPRIVSIGPYHHGKEHLQMIQEHKHRFLEVFIDKTKETGVGLQELINALSGLEDDIRASYSQNLCELDREKLIHMMVLDGCFMLALFCIVAHKVSYTDFGDPIFSMAWILPFLRSDMLLLENQIPFFVLQTLFKCWNLFSSSVLNEIVLEFFSYAIERPEESWKKYSNLEANHLLDLFRKSFIPCSSQESSKEKEKALCLPIRDCSNIMMKTKSAAKTLTSDRPFLRFVLSAKKLHLRGIKFEPSKTSDTFLDIKLKNGVVRIPPITIDDFISSVWLNCIAFEQFYKGCSNHITSYVAFMGCLINTASDAAFLSEKGIIENYFGAEEEVSCFFKSVGKDVALDLERSYLSNVFEGVNEYSSKGWHVHWAGFKHTHFDSPWSCLSSCAALTLLVLTFIQAFFAAYSYVNPPKK